MLFQVAKQPDAGGVLVVAVGAAVGTKVGVAVTTGVADGLAVGTTVGAVVLVAATSFHKVGVAAGFHPAPA